MKKTRQNIDISSLQLNTGQLDWLPKNPRQWTRDDIDKTVASLERDPDFLEDRPLLVTPGEGDKFIVFAGNLRRTAAARLKWKTLPCTVYVIESEEDRMTVIRRSMLDNGTFGCWDTDVLADAWDDHKDQFEDWGIKGIWTKEDQAATEEAEPPTDLDAHDLEVKPFVAKLTFTDDRTLQSFVSKYQDRLKDEFDCILSISGGL